MKYKFEKDLENNLMSMEVVDARRRPCSRDLKELYDIACNIDPTTALNSLRNAESEEEQNFFAFIANMNLQREQKIVMQRQRERYVKEKLKMPGARPANDIAACNAVDIDWFQSGRNTPIEDFPEDGLHPETERVIKEYLENKELK